MNLAGDAGIGFGVEQREAVLPMNGPRILPRDSRKRRGPGVEGLAAFRWRLRWPPLQSNRRLTIAAIASNSHHMSGVLFAE